MKHANSAPISSSIKSRSLRGWLKRATTSTKKVGPEFSKVFGVPLVISIQYAKSMVGYVDDDGIRHSRAGAIPVVVAKCGAYLKKHGLSTEGIFRISGSIKRINELEYLFDQSSSKYGLDLNWDCYTVHDVASTLRRYLNKLPDPVIPFEFYSKFRDIMSDSADLSTENRIEEFQKLIQLLPGPHQHLLLYLLDTLNLFAASASETKMDIPNLAAVFCPGILRHPDHNTPVHYKISQYVIEFLIEYQSLFTLQLLAHRRNTPVDKRISAKPPPVPLLLTSPYHVSPSPPPLPSRAISPTSPIPSSYKSNNPPFVDSPRTITPSSLKGPNVENIQPYDIPHQEIPLKRPFLSTLLALINQALTETKTTILLWTAQPVPFLICATVFFITLIVVLYEIYLAFTIRTFEPLIFFASFICYWYLLYSTVSVTSVPLEEEAEPLFSEEPEEDLLMNELATAAIMDPATEKNMLKDKSIMSKWGDLLTRSWKEEGPTRQNSANSDMFSIMSKSSRFNEEEDHDNGSDSDEEILGFDPDILEAHLSQYYQIKKDAELAKALQVEEQRERDNNNPFLIQKSSTEVELDEYNSSIASPAEEKEEWRIKVFPKP